MRPYWLRCARWCSPRNVATGCWSDCEGVALRFMPSGTALQINFTSDLCSTFYGLITETKFHMWSPLLIQFYLFCRQTSRLHHETNFLTKCSLHWSSHCTRPISGEKRVQHMHRAWNWENNSVTAPVWDDCSSGLFRTPVENCSTMKIVCLPDRKNQSTSCRLSDTDFVEPLNPLHDSVPVHDSAALPLHVLQGIYERRVAAIAAEAPHDRLRRATEEQPSLGADSSPKALEVNASGCILLYAEGLTLKMKNETYDLLNQTGLTIRSDPQCPSNGSSPARSVKSLFLGLYPPSHGLGFGFSSELG